MNIELLCTCIMYNGYYFHTCTQYVDTREGCRQGKGGLPVESKFGGDDIPLQRCITFFKIDMLRVTLIESYTEFKGGRGGGGGLRAGKFSLVRFFNTTLTS